MKPPSVWDKTFRYVPAAATDIAKTFARERARLKKLAEEKPQNVMPLKKERAK